jgi:hypothetical protein
MTDKVQKIKEWISKEQDGLMDAQGNFEYPEHEGAYHILCNLDTYIDSLQEEPVSEEWIKELRTKLDSMSKEDFKKVFDKYAVDFNEEPVSEELEKIVEEITEPTVLNAYGTKELARRLRNTIIYGTSVSKELDEVAELYTLDDSIKPWRNLTKEAFKAGAKWKETHLWKHADGDDLPEIDREVIALLNNGKVVFAHRPYKGKYIGKSLTTGNIETFENKTYGKGGWNIPNAKYWLDCNMDLILKRNDENNKIDKR